MSPNRDQPKYYSVLFWVVAVVFTVTMAYVQRTTGPTYPLSGSVSVGSETVSYTLKRTSELAGSDPEQWDMPVEIAVTNPSISGVVVWKRYKYDELLHQIEMYRHEGVLRADLPHQPPAGKLEYRVILRDGVNEVFIPANEPVVTRFKGFVPLWALLPHILFMFTGLLVAARTALAAMFSQKIERIVWTTMGLFIVGGLILGPIVQKYAFGAFWTGWPFGEDLTDNKTLVMVLAWIPALWFTRKAAVKSARIWAVIAMVVTFGVYMIPHSMRGSEIDYNTVNQDSLKVVQSISTETADSINMAR